MSAQTGTIKSFIPKDYDTLQTATGDLNNDGVNDVALVLYNKIENKDDGSVDQDKIPPRLLIILFGTKQDYIKSAFSSKAIMCKDCGGVFGDPFNDITIQKEVLVISHYGGSSDRWSFTDRFRFQNNNWYLIGKTQYSYSNLQ